MSNPVAPLLAESLVGCDGINPFEPSKKSVDIAVKVNETFDINSACNNSRYVFESLAQFLSQKGVSLESINDIYQMCEYAFRFKTGDNFYGLIEKIQTIKDEIKNSENLDVDNQKTL